MGLSDDEKDDFADKFRNEIAEKYRRRAELAAQPKKDKPFASTTDPDAEREAELAKLRLEVMDAYHKDNDFVRYVDSRGQERWLSPEEYERMRHRRRRKKRPIYEPIWGNSFRRGLFMAFALVLAVVLGWYLAE